jgi:hypothetical protein
MADEITSKILIEIRDEARAFRVETREHFETTFHRLNLVESVLPASSIA